MKAVEAVETLQKFLNNYGFNLLVDGDLGPKTKAAIDSLEAPNYIKTALKEVGTKEIAGKVHKSRVLQYHSVSGGFSTDEVPWCGSFVNWVMKTNKYPTVIHPAAALSWLNFGIKSPVPTLGSIAVKSRKGGGHVCFVVGRFGPGKLLCLGGNQSDEVNIRVYDEYVFKEFRVPKNEKVYALKNINLTLNNTAVKES